MSDTTAPNDPKRRVMATFNTIAAAYDTPRLVQRCAHRLVARAPLSRGARVLDVATGTGGVALAAAQRVGPTGRVVGIDLAADMLASARQKLTAAGLTQVEFCVGDAEHLEFPAQSFDVVLCAASLFFVPDMLAALREWGRVLVPGGYVGVCGFGPTFLQPLRDLWTARLQQYGVTPAAFPWQRLADLATCQHLLDEAGFGQIEVQQEQLGYYLQTVEEWWEESWASPRRLAVLQLTPVQQAQFKAAHLAEVAALATAQGLWINVDTNFACGWKGGAHRG